MPARYAPWALSVREMAELFGVDRAELLRLCDASEIPKPAEASAGTGKLQRIWHQRSVRMWWENERGAPLPAILRDPLPENVRKLETYPAPTPLERLGMLPDEPGSQHVVVRRKWYPKPQRPTTLKVLDRDPIGERLLASDLAAFFGVEKNMVLAWRRSGLIPQYRWLTPLGGSMTRKAYTWWTADLRQWWIENRPGEEVPRFLTG